MSLERTQNKIDILIKLKAVIKWTDGTRKSHVKLKIYI